jgi:hypothetical protein
LEDLTIDDVLLQLCDLGHVGLVVHVDLWRGVVGGRYGVSILALGRFTARDEIRQGMGPVVVTLFAPLSADDVTDGGRTARRMIDPYHAVCEPHFDVRPPAVVGSRVGQIFVSGHQIVRQGSDE